MHTAQELSAIADVTQPQLQRENVHSLTGCHVVPGGCLLSLGKTGCQQIIGVAHSLHGRCRHVCKHLLTTRKMAVKLEKVQNKL